MAAALLPALPTALTVQARDSDAAAGYDDLSYSARVPTSVLQGDPMKLAPARCLSGG
jgi:hypothetical protein